ncbi:hypothetical protein Hanom_Chr14g01283131 [Helianthus anomalus]
MTVTRMWTESTAVLVYRRNQRRKPSSQMGLPRLTVATMFGYQILRTWRSYMVVVTPFLILTISIGLLWVVTKPNLNAYPK